MIKKLLCVTVFILLIACGTTRTKLIATDFAIIQTELGDIDIYPSSLKSWAPAGQDYKPSSSSL